MNYTIPLATALALGVGIALGADEPAKTNDVQTATNVVVIISTNYGNITVELDAAKAPITVKNFLAYVDEKFYDGTIFHRVIKNFMIQGGGFDQNMRL